MGTDILVLFLKTNLAILVFYGIYRLLFIKDTFFRWKRFVLLAFYFIAGLYPLVDLSDFFFSHQATLSDWGKTWNVQYLEEIIVRPLTSGVSSGSSVFYTILTIVYLIGLTTMLIYVLLQTVLILKIFVRSKKEETGEVDVRVSPDISAPFSFWNWIFIPDKTISSQDLQEIIIHERTHVVQLHSLDTLLSTLACVAFWFNPAVWLLRREVRINLEFLADGNVLNSGCDAEHYQLHLLRLSHYKAAAQLTNNFNVSPLKKRIMMMNKQQRSKKGLLKYLLLIPVIGSLLFVNCVQKKQAEEQPETKAPVEEAVSPVETPASDTENKAYQVVEQMPSFPGGDKALMKYLSENINYPEDAKQNGVEGRVVTRFVVQADGSLSDVEIVRSLNPSCDKEAIRVIKTMPKWEPGKQNGELVSVFYALPIRYKLSD